jgi:hypothetical protein
MLIQAPNFDNEHMYCTKMYVSVSEKLCYTVI